MIKTATVASIKPSDSFTTQHGTFYSFWVNFSNGDGGLYNSKSENQTKFVVGQEATYSMEAKTSQKGNTWYKIKPQNPEFAQGASNNTSGGYSSGSANQEEIMRQTCLIAATTVTTSVENALKGAETFFNWVKAATTKSDSIVRQSCLKSAATLKANGATGSVIEIAEQFLAFVKTQEEQVTPEAHMADREQPQAAPAPAEPEAAEVVDDLPF